MRSLMSPHGMTPRRLRRLLNVYPPFLFAGIRVTAVGEDWRSAGVELRMRWWNRNYVGTHFGGSLFAMTDPFWMILVLQSLGRDYIVWDRAAEIEFRKPGRGTVRADFRLQETALEEIRAAATAAAVTGTRASATKRETPPAPPDEPPAIEGRQRGATRRDGSVTILPSGAILRWFECPVVDADGDTVAHVRKQLYVRRKPA